VDVHGVGARVAGSALRGPSDERSATGVATAIDTTMEPHQDDARSVCEPPGLVFSRRGLSPGRVSRFVADL
jgi:hypothetical protein